MAVARETTGVEGLEPALSAIVERTAEVAGADGVVARLRDESGGLTAHAVHAASAALRAELEGSRLAADAVPADTGDLADLPRPLRAVADRMGAGGVLLLPVLDGDVVVGSLELLRRRGTFGERERRLAAAIADEIAVVRRAFGNGDASSAATPDLLRLAGDALAAG